MLGLSCTYAAKSSPVRSVSSKTTSSGPQWNLLPLEVSREVAGEVDVIRPVGAAVSKHAMPPVTGAQLGDAREVQVGKARGELGAEAETTSIAFFSCARHQGQHARM